MAAKLLLNGIVKNEANRIERMLESVATYISGYAIVDTGSTDDTCTRIEEFFDKRDIPGIISEAPFHDWGQARNAALDLAFNCELAYDYIFLVDADMELVVRDPRVFSKLGASAYQMMQRAGALEYKNTRLLSRLHPARYVGVTHEYLDCGPVVDLDGAFFNDHADGANRPGKLKRDITLLTKDLRQNPTNVRSLFYLANSYRDDGQHRLAIANYDKRILAGGWDQEVWNSIHERAKCYKAIGREDKYVLGLIEAFNYRPSRGEPLYDLANYYRLKGKNDLATMFARKVLSLPKPTDDLFVNVFAHTYGPKEELSISGFYSRDKKEKAEAFGVCDALSLDPAAPQATRDQAARNLFYYLEPLATYCPSFEAKQIVWTPPDGYVATNPSIATKQVEGHKSFGDAVTFVKNELWGVIRTVNYRMDDAGRYLIRNTETGEINNSNPIHTRSFLARFNDDLTIGSAREIELPYNWPDKKYHLVVGFEDMRLVFRDDEPWINACVREQNEEGWCEQWEARIEVYGTVASLVDPVRMFHGPVRLHEKNWSPVDGYRIIREGTLALVHPYQYRLGTIVDGQGGELRVHNIPSPIYNISGGTQVIPFNGGWLTCVHQAGAIPGHSKRYYQHRFVLMDHEFKPLVVSSPFVFHDREIEFAAGLTTKDDKILISYGRRDNEAWIASIHRDEVREMLHVAG
jgi:glycosyltransferase involved in cell wall biosynthesis